MTDRFDRSMARDARLQRDSVESSYGPGKNPASHQRGGGGAARSPMDKHSDVLKAAGYGEPSAVHVGGEYSHHAFHGPRGAVHVTPDGRWHHQLHNGSRSGSSPAGLARSLREPTGRYKISKSGIEEYPHVQYKPGETEAARRRFSGQ